jgi:hypothetical protein
MSRRTCKINNCNEICQPRKHLCEFHRNRGNSRLLNNVISTTRQLESLVNDDPYPRLRSRPNGNVTSLLEEKNERDYIMQHQENEYDEALRTDKERLDNLTFEKEVELLLKKTKEEMILNKKNILDNEEIDLKNCYHIKFKLSTGKVIERKFNVESKFENLRNFIEVYFYDNNILIDDFDLSTTYPKQLFTLKENSSMLKDSFKDLNIVFYIVNNDII